MNESREDHPPWLAVFAKLLGGLEQMLELRHVRVRIAVIDELVQILSRFPDAHFHPVQPEKFLSLGESKIVRLVEVVEPVELAHRRACIHLVVAKLFLFLVRVSRFELRGGGGFGVAFLHEIFPFIEALERSVFVRRI